MVVSELFAKLGLQFDAEAFQNAEKAMMGLAGGLTAVAAAAAAAGAAFVYEMGKISEAAFETLRAAQASGVTTTALQELQFAAKVSGTSVEALSHGMRHLALMTVEAAQGSVDAAYSLSLMGIKTHDAAGKVIPVDQIMETLADRFQKMPDGLNKTGMAMRLFGRAGNELIPFLNKGRAGIDELKQKAEEFGVVMDENLIKRAGEYRMSQIKLSAAIDGLKLSIFGAALGTSKWREALTAWIVEHRKIIGLGVEKFFGAISRAVLVIVRASLVWFELWKAGFELIGKIIDKIFGVGTAAKIVETGVKGLGNTLLAAFLLPIAPIAAVLIALEDLYVFLKGGKSVIGEYLIPAFKGFFTEKLPMWLGQARTAVDKFFGDLKNDLEIRFPALKVLDKLMGGAVGSAVSTLANFTPPGIVLNEMRLAGQGVNALFGGGASPTASARAQAGASEPEPNFSGAGGVSVYVTNNIDGQQFHATIDKRVEQHGDKQRRETNAAVGGAR